MNNNLTYNENMIIENFLTQTKKDSEGNFIDLKTADTSYSIIRQEIVNNVLPKLKNIIKEDQVSVQEKLDNVKNTQIDNIEDIHLLTCSLNKLENNLRVLSKIENKVKSLT